MIGKSTIAALVLVTMGLASPAFAQVPPSYYYGHTYPYGQQAPFGWGFYDNGGWPPGPASVDSNAHTPPNH
jgi:hypothetical protein